MLKSFETAKGKFALLLTVSLFFLLLAGCLGGCGNGSTDTIVMKAGHAVAESHPYHLGLEKFKELVEERTDGQMEIDLYANGTLGSERDMIEGLQLGSIDFVVTSTGPVGNFIPEMNVVDLPFLFSSTEHAHKVLDGKVGQDLLEKFDEIEIVGLAFWENGFRHLTNSKHPINEVGDIAGLKIRTMENAVHQDTFRVLGADPTPMSWDEVYSALQQKTIHGQENPIPIIYNMNIYEVQPYIALTGHFYSPTLLLMGEKSMDKLTAEQEDIVREAAVEAAVFERAQIQAQEDEQLAKLEEAGAAISRPDRIALREATQSIYEKYESNFGKELIDEILAAE